MSPPAQGLGSSRASGTDLPCINDFVPGLLHLVFDALTHVPGVSHQLVRGISLFLAIQCQIALE